MVSSHAPGEPFAGSNERRLRHARSSASWTRSSRSAAGASRAASRPIRPTCSPTHAANADGESGASPAGGPDDVGDAPALRLRHDIAVIVTPGTTRRSPVRLGRSTHRLRSGAMSAARAPSARFGGQLATDLCEVADLTRDPGVLDRSGWWAVVGTFEGALTGYRFARVEPSRSPATAPWIGPDRGAWHSSMDETGYRAGVAAIREHIAAGN